MAGRQYDLRTNCERHLTERDYVQVRRLLANGRYQAATTYLYKETACPPFCEDNIIQELQHLYYAPLELPINNSLDDGLGFFYPDMGK